MSDLRPGTPTQRPETARPREDAEPAIEPPSLDELGRIQRHLCSLPVHAGAVVADDEGLGVLVVRGVGDDGKGAGAGPDVDFVARPRWSAHDWRARLGDVADAMRARGAWPALLLVERLDRPPGLARALPSAGWVKVHDESVLWVGSASVVPHLDPALRIEAVQPRTIADHEALERQVFGFPEAYAAVRREQAAAALATGRLRAFVVWLHDEPVAVARLSQGDGVACIYAVGVAEDRRGLGFGRLITTVATRAGMALGNRVVWLSVQDDNAPAIAVYEGLGFKRAFGWSRWLARDGVVRG